LSPFAHPDSAKSAKKAGTAIKPRIQVLRSEVLSRVKFNTRLTYRRRDDQRVIGSLEAKAELRSGAK